MDGWRQHHAGNKASAEEAGDVTVGGEDARKGDEGEHPHRLGLRIWRLQAPPRVRPSSSSRCIFSLMSLSHFVGIWCLSYNEKDLVVQLPRECCCP